MVVTVSKRSKLNHSSSLRCSGRCVLVVAAPMLRHPVRDSKVPSPDWSIHATVNVDLVGEIVTSLKSSKSSPQTCASRLLGSGESRSLDTSCSPNRSRGQFLSMTLKEAPMMRRVTSTATTIAKRRCSWTWRRGVNLVTFRRCRNQFSSCQSESLHAPRSHRKCAKSFECLHKDLNTRHVL